MTGTVGHLVVFSDGVSEDGGWRGKWTIHRPDRESAAANGGLLLVADGETQEIYSDQVEAQKVSHEIGMSRAQELYDER
jgi:hypothetical protein